MIYLLFLITQHVPKFLSWLLSTLFPANELSSYAVIAVTASCRWYYLRSDVDITYAQMLILCMFKCGCYVCSNVDITYAQMLILCILKCWYYVCSNIDITYAQILILRMFKCGCYVCLNVVIMYAQMLILCTLKCWHYVHSKVDALMTHENSSIS